MDYNDFVGILYLRRSKFKSFTANLKMDIFVKGDAKLYARGPKGRGIITRQRAKIAVQARNTNIIFCKII
jgi:hypothetical protein